MARSKQTPEFDIVVDGEPFVWWLQRQPGWNSDDNAFTGMALAARHSEGQREVVLEFPPPATKPKFGATTLKPTQIPVDLVARAIASAIAAGWEPLSRGKTVTIAVDAKGG
ncbi:MAG: hypothetical protein BGN86_15790 [Caulobacterales bacterium 68-7]|nr:MAG: hypothetical protein BGN86_15790 [Caulobacterales bacterium 68-7]